MSDSIEIKIYVINLDSSTERLKSIDHQLFNLGLKYERISAVNGKYLSNKDLNSHYSKFLNKIKYRANLTNGEIGCYLSHRNTWLKVIENKNNVALILEDDAIIDGNILKLLKLLSKFNKFDLIKIAHTTDTPAVNRKFISNDFFLVNYKKIPNCTTAYLISSNGAKKLMARKLFYRPVDVDVQFSKELSLSVVGIQPSVVKANAIFDSDIMILNKGIHRNKSSIFRNIKYRLSLFWHRQFYLSANIY